MTMSDHGWFEATFKAPCDLSEINPTREWITKLLLQNPDLTGWPFFVDLWNPRHPDWKPYIRDGIWECRIEGQPQDDIGIDYWRIDGKAGLFFVARAIEDDTSPRSPDPGNTLEFSLAIVRTAEILTIASHFSDYLCDSRCDAAESVQVNLRWNNLQGRQLSNRAERSRYLSLDYTSHSPEVKEVVKVPLNATKDQISLCTQKAVSNLFLQFDGWECTANVIDDLVIKFLSRKW